MRNTCKACHQCPTHTRECLSFHIRSIIQCLSSCNGSFPCLKNSGVSIQFTSISRRLIANSPSKYSHTNVAHHTQIGYTYKNVWSNKWSPMYSIFKKNPSPAKNCILQLQCKQYKHYTHSCTTISPAVWYHQRP